MDTTFFIVEDHTLTSLGIRQLLLKHANFSLAGFASSKSEALEKLSALSEQNALPDMLIVDLFLGKESGIDVIREVNIRFSRVKIVVYSMYAKPGIVSLALENGADGFVEKSAPESELLFAIEKIMAGESYVQQNLIAPLFTYRTMFDGLTRQEQSIFKKIVERKSNSQIAKDLNIVSRSLENYLSRIYNKTGCKNHEELIRKFGE